MTREAEAWAAYNVALLDIFTPKYDGELERLRADVRDAILAAERERTAALVAAATRVDAWYIGAYGGDALWPDVLHDLRAALRAYEEGVSE